MSCQEGIFIPEVREKVLSVSGVKQVFRQNNRNSTTVLEDLNLDVANLVGKPQVLSILGPSGCGKTTMLRLLSGLDKPAAGEILITNGDQTMRPVKAGEIGVIFQKNPLFPDLSVLNNLIYAPIKHGMSFSDARDLAYKYLYDFNLYNQRYSWPAQLSGGQLQRTAILQQLMVPNRHFIILDEPFSRLDSESILAVIKLLNKVAMTHDLNTFVVVTHDITSALIISDHVHLLGKPSPEKGSKIIHTFDLIGEGLAYHPDIEEIPRFNEIRKEIKYKLMPTL